MYRLLQFILKKLIAKERRRQVKLGYNLLHDIKAIDRNPTHLYEQAVVHYYREHYIQVLALIDASLVYSNYKNTQERNDSQKSSEEVEKGSQAG